MFTVGELKEFIKDIDDSTALVLQMNNDNYTYIAMDNGVNADYDENIMALTFGADATDVLTPKENEYLKSLKNRK